MATRYIKNSIIFLYRIITRKTLIMMTSMKIKTKLVSIAAPMVSPMTMGYIARRNQRIEQIKFKNKNCKRRMKAQKMKILSLLRLNKFQQIKRYNCLNKMLPNVNHQYKVTWIQRLKAHLSRQDINLCKIKVAQRQCSWLNLMISLIYM